MLSASNPCVFEAAGIGGRPLYGMDRDKNYFGMTVITLYCSNCCHCLVAMVLIVVMVQPHHTLVWIVFVLSYRFNQIRITQLQLLTTPASRHGVGEDYLVEGYSSTKLEICSEMVIVTTLEPMLQLVTLRSYSNITRAKPSRC